MMSKLGRQAGDGAARLPEEDRARRCRCKRGWSAGCQQGQRGAVHAAMVFGATSGTLDTLTNQFDYAFPPFNTVYEGLTRYPPGDKWQAVNTLAESLELSSDGKTISFTLKKGIPFHGGYGEVVAEDVQYSFYRAVGKEKLYPDAAKDDTSWYGGDFGSLREIKLTGSIPASYCSTSHSLPWSA